VATNSVRCVAWKGDTRKIAKSDARRKCLVELNREFVWIKLVVIIERQMKQAVKSSIVLQ